MKDDFRSFAKIFSFTFKQHVRSKGYRNATIIIGLLCLLVPAIIMTVVEGTSKDKKEYTTCNVKQVLVVDNSTTDKVDLNILNSINKEGFEAISYKSFDNIEEANEEAGNLGGYALVMAIDEEDGFYNVSLIKPEDTRLKEDDVDSFRNFVGESFSFVLVQKSGLSDEQLMELSLPVTIEKEEAETGESGGYAEAKKVMSMVLPYLNIMVLYFLILIYGQDVSNSVIMEKTSKLMDTFLVAVKPGAMVIGKVLAIALTGIAQLTIWIAGLVGGFAAGTYIVKSMNPATNMGIIKLFETFGSVSGIFTIQGMVLAIFIILSGFLLYCSIAAIGGSMASKPEDLSSTNMLFTLALVISFLCTLYSGGMDAGMSSSAEWLNWFPLTAILVTPSRILVGQASLITGLASMTIVLICSVLIMLLAGKIYKLMSLYKGNPPSIGKVFKMLKSKN